MKYVYSALRFVSLQVLTPTSPAETNPPDGDRSATPAPESAPSDAPTEPVVPSVVVADMLGRKDTTQLEVQHWVRALLSVHILFSFKTPIYKYGKSSCKLGFFFYNYIIESDPL